MTGYKKKLLASYKLTEFHNVRWFDTNMVASLACADEWLQLEPSIISYSDIFYETSDKKMVFFKADADQDRRNI